MSRNIVTSVSRAAAAAAAGTVLFACSLAFGPRPAAAQLYGAPGSGGGGQIGQTRTTASSLPANVAANVGLDQKLDAQVSLNTLFRDESGKTVPLSTYFGDRPVLLLMPFYKCPGVCAAELDGLEKVLADPRLKFRVGRDFQAVTVSIDPTEGPQLATAKKREYMSLLDQPQAASGWHFLTGTDASIRKLASEVGFRYTFDPKTHQYTHPAGLMLLTSGGKVSKYFYGVEYSPTDLRLALTDAGRGKIGSIVDQIALYCCTFDPTTGTYSVAIFRIIQIAGCLTVVLLAGFMALALRRDYSGGVGAAGAVTPIAELKEQGS